MWFKSNPESAPVPNSDKLELMDEYFKSLRESNVAENQ